MKRLAIVAYIAFVSLEIGSAHLQAWCASIVRGPYLQQGTSTGATVRWRTDTPTDSLVQYGPTAEALSLQVHYATQTTEHIVTLTDLLPGTRYYYSVGSSSETLAGGDAGHYLITHPLAGAVKPVRIWVLGDSGFPNNGLRAVRDAFYALNGDRHTDVWLMLGDNAYPVGTDEQYQAAVFNMFPTFLRKTFLWPTLGNHEFYNGITSSDLQTGPYFSIFTLPTRGEAGGFPSGTEAYYSFDFANIHFICLDSEHSDRSLDGPMLTWLRNDLASTDQDWKIVFWHQPPYSKGSHDSDNIRDGEGRMVDMRENVLPILETAGVDLVLTGHSHSYERSYHLHGHYGFSDSLVETMIVDRGDGREDGDGAYRKGIGEVDPSNGTVYVVLGSSSQTRGGSLDHPAMHYSSNTLGSLVIDLHDNRLEQSFINDRGEKLDYFTIIKNLSTNVPVWPQYD